MAGQNFSTMVSRQASVGQRSFAAVHLDIYIWPIFVLWAVMDTIADYATGVIIAGRKPKHK